MIFHNSISLFFFSSKLTNLIQFRIQRKFFNLILINLLTFFSFFIFLLFLFFILLNNGSIFFSLDYCLFYILGDVVNQLLHLLQLIYNLQTMIFGEKIAQCQRHKREFVAICKSPRCDYYRQLCTICQEDDSIHKKEYHLKLQIAIKQASTLGKKGLMGLQSIRARKNHQMEENMINNPGLMEIQAKLDEISKQIIKKIQQFRSNIKKIYSNHVRQKLDQLDEVIQKSQEFLKRQINQIQSGKTVNLGVFFRTDILHEVKYFQSYFNEIFVKKIRSFKTAIENDRIFSLLTNFSQSLQKLFIISKDIPQQDRLRQLHLFLNEDGQCYLYSLSQNLKEIVDQPIAAMNRIAHSRKGLQQQRQYAWVGAPQSVYYPSGKCYYIIGQGERQSKVIVKYEYQKSVEDTFTIAKIMQTERNHFAVCLLNGEIYIIGGENSKQGCLAKCQKFVPLHNNQVYIIHSLRYRSSRHSVTTYKDKYILKFGGVRRQLNHVQNIKLQQIAAPPQIYSLKTEQWSVIPFTSQSKVVFHLYPSIFKVQNRNFILVLGGDTLVPPQANKRPAFQVILQESHGQIDQVKIRIRQSKVIYKQKIFNSTIALLDQDHQCVFMKTRGGRVEIGNYKLQF